MANYLDFWNVKEAIFAGSSKDGDIFLPKSWASVIERSIAYSLQPQSLMTITAKEGVGKSELARYLYKNTPAATHECLLVSTISAPKEITWLSSRVAKFMDTNYQPSVDAGHEIEEVAKLLDQLREENRKLLVIIDGAEKITSPEGLEGIYNLLQLQSYGVDCLSAILIGGPKIERIVESCPLSQFYSYRGELTPFSEYETWSFLDWKLNKAGVTPSPFSEEASKEIYRISKGLPRSICSIAEACFIEASIMNTKNIGDALVAQVAKSTNRSTNGTADKSVKTATKKEPRPSYFEDYDPVESSPNESKDMKNSKFTDRQPKEPSASRELPLLSVVEEPAVKEDHFQPKSTAKDNDTQGLDSEQSPFSMANIEESGDNAKELDKAIVRKDPSDAGNFELEQENSGQSDEAENNNLFEKHTETEKPKKSKKSFFSGDWVEESKVSNPGKFSNFFRADKTNGSNKK